MPKTIGNPKNPVTVRGEPVQSVETDGSWESQVTLDIDDFRGVIRNAIEKSGGGDGPFTRRDGDVLEVYWVHNTKTGAEGTIRRLKKNLYVEEGVMEDRRLKRALSDLKESVETLGEQSEVSIKKYEAALENANSKAIELHQELRKTLKAIKGITKGWREGTMVRDAFKGDESKLTDYARMVSELQVYLTDLIWLGREKE